MSETYTEYLGKVGHRLPAVPSAQDIELAGGATMLPAAQRQRDLAALAMKEQIAGRATPLSELLREGGYMDGEPGAGCTVIAGPCAANPTIETPDGPRNDAVAFQDTYRGELHAQARDADLPISVAMGGVRVVATRAGLYKDRTGEGWAGIWASQPVEARQLPVLLANNGVQDTDIPLVVATEVVEPMTEIADYLALPWYGARRSESTILRHFASGPILDTHSLNLLRMLADPGVGLEHIKKAAETNSILSDAFTVLERSGLPESAARAQMQELIIDYHQRPALFKTAQNGDATTALTSRLVTSKPQQDVFIGKDGRSHGPIPTPGNPYIGLLFRGGTEMTPDAFRRDLRAMQVRVDTIEEETGERVVWGIDDSHASAKQCAYGHRTEAGQEVAHEVVSEEVEDGNIRPKFVMMEATIHPGRDEKGGWGRSRVDYTVSARAAARMTLRLAGAVRAAPHYALVS